MFPNLLNLSQFTEMQRDNTPQFADLSKFIKANKAIPTFLADCDHFILPLIIEIESICLLIRLSASGWSDVAYSGPIFSSQVDG